MGINKYMSLEIGGKVRGLNFNWGTVKCLDEIIDVDALSYKPKSDSIKDVDEYVKNITHAALLSNCLSKKEAPSFTSEDVAIWINDLSGFEIEQIMEHYHSMFKPPKPSANGEVSKDTQPGQVANV